MQRRAFSDSEQRDFCTVSPNLYRLNHNKPECS